MSEMLQEAIKGIWEILVQIPMPWRTVLAILIIVIIFYWPVWRSFLWLVKKLGSLLLFFFESVASILLLPEYWVTKQLRRVGLRPLPGTYLFGDLLQSTITLIHSGTIKLAEKQWHLPKWLALLIIIAPMLLWYVRPVLDETTVASYIDQGIVWWYSFENWALTGEWVSPTQSGSSISGESVLPTSNTPTPTRPTQKPTPTAIYEIYVVKPGDSLNKIASRFGVTVAELIAANKEKYPSLVTDPASIKIGWELRVPKDH